MSAERKAPSNNFGCSRNTSLRMLLRYSEY
jgi:hypothetical protein